MSAIGMPLIQVLPLALPASGLLLVRQAMGAGSRLLPSQALDFGTFL